MAKVPTTTLCLIAIVVILSLLTTTYSQRVLESQRIAIKRGIANNNIYDDEGDIDYKTTSTGGDSDPCAPIKQEFKCIEDQDCRWIARSASCESRSPLNLSSYDGGSSSYGYASAYKSRTVPSNYGGGSTSYEEGESLQFLPSLMKNTTATPTSTLKPLRTAETLLPQIRAMVEKKIIQLYTTQALFKNSTKSAQTTPTTAQVQKNNNKNGVFDDNTFFFGPKMVTEQQKLAFFDEIESSQKLFDEESGVITSKSILGYKPYPGLHTAYSEKTKELKNPLDRFKKSSAVFEAEEGGRDYAGGYGSGFLSGFAEEGGRDYAGGYGSGFLSGFAEEGGDDHAAGIGSGIGSQFAEEGGNDHAAGIGSGIGSQFAEDDEEIQKKKKPQAIGPQFSAIRSMFGFRHGYQMAKPAPVKTLKFDDEEEMINNFNTNGLFDEASAQFITTAYSPNKKPAITKVGVTKSTMSSTNGGFRTTFLEEEEDSYPFKPSRGPWISSIGRNPVTVSRGR